MTGLTVLLIYIAGAIALAYSRSDLRTTAFAAGGLLLVYLLAGNFSWFWFLFLLVNVAIAGFLSQRQLRRDIVSSRLLNWYRGIMPKMSETEQEAVNAGTVWWEGDLFTGKPDWEKLLSTGKPGITAAEQEFIDGPVEQLCRMVDSWKVNFELADIPPEVMTHVRQHRFLGMVIPNEYGGLGLSSVAQTEVYTRLFGISSGKFYIRAEFTGPRRVTAEIRHAAAKKLLSATAGERR